VTSKLEQSQEAAFRAADQKCTGQSLKKYPVAVLDAAGETRLYNAELKNFQCIEKQGLSLAAPPSLQVYLQSYDSNRWSAAGELTPTAFPQLFKDGQERYQKILTTCRPPLWNQ
jgi:hypothetical protein